MHVQADAGEGLGRSQGNRRRQRKEYKRGKKERVQAFYRVYLVQFVFQLKSTINEIVLDSSELLHSQLFSEVCSIFMIAQYL